MALKTCCEYIRGLRYRLRMLGIPVLQPAFIYGNNEAVVKNSVIPELTLKKKSHSIAYYYVRQGVARNKWLIFHIQSEYNCSDTLTKTVPAGAKRKWLVSCYLYDIYECGS